MPIRKRLNDAEREQRRAEDRLRVDVAARQLLSSEGWQRWVRVRARNGLSRYSAVIWSHPVSSPPATRGRALTTCR